MQATYEYGPRGDMPAGEAHVVSRRQQAADLDRRAAFRKWGDGCLFIGDKGMLLSDYGKHVLLPEKDFDGLQAARADDSRLARPSRGMDPRLQDRRATTCNFEYSGWLTEANHLGNVAYRAGKKLEWDADEDESHELPRGRSVHQAGICAGWKLG